MNDLSEAFASLRAEVLCRVARRRGLLVDQADVRRAVKHLSDKELMDELRRKSSIVYRIWGMFRNR